ncbi:MAG: hypothetical protein HW411_1618 [Gammaproteobacteria bacterium]|nr:hypothetical protein [Gammaproteobacteria bacterium]
MSGEPKKDTAASVRQRLLNISKETGEDFNLVLTRYGLERMLYRLGKSEWRDLFLLKGAMLFTLWHNEPHRPTRDADFLGFMEPEIDELIKIFKSICNLRVINDGIKFNSDTVRAEEIRENNIYEGIRVLLRGELAGANIGLQFDVGFGDAVTPGPEDIIYPTILDQEAPELKAYPVYTVIAEKFETMVKLGIANSRMKDFYDLWILKQKFDLNRNILPDAISATFNRRKTAIPIAIPLALTDEFYKDDSKNRQWIAFIRKNGIKNGLDLKNTINSLVEFFEPIINAINERK